MAIGERCWEGSWSSDFFFDGLEVRSAIHQKNTPRCSVYVPTGAGKQGSWIAERMGCADDSVVGG